ncbi:MAG: hypothetical protein WC149_01200 [Arcobacteraceae bacterium]
MKLKICLIYDFISMDRQRGSIVHSKKLDIFRLILEKLDLLIFSEVPKFSQNTFYEIAKINPSNNIYDDIKLESLNKESLHYLHNCLKDFDYFIGFELSKNTREIFEHLNIKYLDIWISSVRFYKDILLEFNCNDAKIRETLKNYELKESVLYKRTKELIQHSNTFFKQPHIKENSCLIIGQLLQDKSVLKENTFLTLLDYFEAIKTLSLKYNMLYVLKHPLMSQEDFEAIEKRLLEISNIQILQGFNTYHLLCLPQIKCVAGISSSVLTEAHYFGKEVLFFYQPVIEPSSCRIYNHYYDANFWKKILGIKSKKRFVYCVDDHYFRLKYNLIYAYDIFLPTLPEKKLELKEKYNTIINIYNFIETIDVSQKYILYGFGSVGKLLYPHLKNNIVAIVDKVLVTKIKEYEGIPIIALNELGNYTYDKIIVSPFLHQNEITFELRNYANQLIQIKV